MTKSERQAKILEIISENAVSTQDEIVRILNDSGYNAVAYTHLDVYKRHGVIPSAFKRSIYCACASLSVT